jgi:copper chaperone
MEAEMKHLFKVQDMTCGHCVARVTKQLQTFDPEARVEIDLPAREVSIDGAADRGDYAYALRDAGYSPE